MEETEKPIARNRPHAQTPIRHPERTHLQPPKFLGRQKPSRCKRGRPVATSANFSLHNSRPDFQRASPSRRDIRSVTFRPSHPTATLKSHYAPPALPPPQAQPHTIPGLGTFTPDRFGSWLATIDFAPARSKIGISFSTGDTPPGPDEAALITQLADAWPTLWPRVRADLQSDLARTPGCAQAAQYFVDQAHPIAFVFHGAAASISDTWEIAIDPSEWSSHVLTILLKNLDYQTYRLDG